MKWVIKLANDTLKVIHLKFKIPHRIYSILTKFPINSLI